MIHAHRGEIRCLDAKILSVGGPACWHLRQAARYTRRQGEANYEEL